VASSIDGRAYRPYWSQRTRLVKLLEEGAIDRDAFAAGIKLRGWCDTLFSRGEGAELGMSRSTGLVRPTMPSSSAPAGYRP
jgi:hypothetical protein